MRATVRPSAVAAASAPGDLAAAGAGAGAGGDGDVVDDDQRVLDEDGVGVVVGGSTSRGRQPCRARAAV